MTQLLRCHCIDHVKLAECASSDRAQLEDEPSYDPHSVSVGVASPSYTTFAKLQNWKFVT